MKTLEPLVCLHLQLRLEGKEVINGCFLRQVEVVPDEEVPLMLVARLVDQGLIAYYEEAIAPDLQRHLSAARIDFPDISPLLDIFAAYQKQVEAGHYKTYVFPCQPAAEPEVLCLSKLDSRVQAFRFDSFAEQVYAVEKNGSLISACVSTRENKACGEAWVYTLPEYRKQGFAQKVVRAWARGLMETGKVPFYSHSIKNEASANLAGKLGLQPMFEEITLTQMEM